MADASDTAANDAPPPRFSADDLPVDGRDYPADLQLETRRMRLHGFGFRHTLDLLRLGREYSIWEAVLVVRDGAVFGFVADGEHACLRAADGQDGCFTLPRAAQE